MNCKGETDRFRILEMDENYKEKKFNEKITNQLLQISKNLKGWNPKVIQNHNVDYYQYLIFKIQDGNLIEIDVDALSKDIANSISNKVSSKRKVDKLVGGKNK